MDKSKILVARRDQQAFMQLVGRGSFQNASVLKKFYVELLEQGVCQFLLDLNECTYLDSTFLGTLTGLGMRLRGEPKGRLHVLNASSRNLELMQNLGLDKVPSIDIRGVDFTPPLPSDLKEASKVPATKEEIGRQMLEAHQQLIQIDAQNLPKFKDVIAYLEEDLGKSSDA